MGLEFIVIKEVRLSSFYNRRALKTIYLSLSNLQAIAILSAFACNALGDHLNQTTGSVTTSYVDDYIAGLTQMLDDGTNTFLYGAECIAQYNTNLSTMEYFGTDRLGSERQIYDDAGTAIADHRFDPFGNTISQSGVRWRKTQTR